MEVGRLTLDTNPVDWDNPEIEQLAFEPNNMVPRHRAEPPTRCFLARGFSYADAHRARLGGQLQADSRQSGQGGGGAFLLACGTRPHGQRGRSGLMRPTPTAAPAHSRKWAEKPPGWPTAKMVRAAYTLREDDDDWSQPGALVREVMDDGQRDRFVEKHFWPSRRWGQRTGPETRIRLLAQMSTKGGIIVAGGGGDRIEGNATRDLLGGESKSRGMASAESISGYHGIPATSSIAKGEGRKNALADERKVAPGK